MKLIRLTESDIHKIVTEVVANLCESPTREIVYHCGDEISEAQFKDVIWFSTEPIDKFGDQHRYEVTMNNPLIINAHGAGWSDKLWKECDKSSGELMYSVDDPMLTSIAPAFIWEIVHNSDEEYEYGDIPYIIRRLRNEGKVSYDGVILRQIGETPTCNIITDDYVVFDLKQVRPY